METLPNLLQGESNEDFRGSLIHFNQFDLTPVKRFYTIVPVDTKTVRAWQGHKKEQKWFHVLAGTFKIVIVKPDSWESPSVHSSCVEFIVSIHSNQILHVPGGFLNGFKALDSNSRLMVFSDCTLEDSANDDYRFDPSMWNVW